MLTGFPRWLSKFGICAIVGAIAGSLTGMMFGLTLVAQPTHTLSFHDALLASILLGLLDWVVVVIALVVFGGYQLSVILFPSFVTCMVASICTALLLNTLHRPFAGMFGMLIGWFLGLAIGFLFCRICRIVPGRQVSAQS